MFGPTNQPQLVASGPALQATGLIHRVQEPTGPGPHPTVVMLHGRSGSEDVMWIFRKTLPANWLVVAPRAIEHDPRGGYSWFVRLDDDFGDLAAFQPAITAVVDFIHTLPRVYNADPEQVYLMGFSQGAATGYGIAMTQPGLLQAIAGLVGFVPDNCAEDADLSALRELPIFMAVGIDDERIPYERSLGCAAVLRAAGANLTYREYPTGHKLNGQGLQDLQSWWLERGRSQYHQTRI